MKQKNLILMVVAVGCGLLAAFLTSQMSAKPAAATPQIEVLVVAKELPPGTKFTLDSIKDQFKVKHVTNEAIPEKAVISAEALDGKTLNKTLRADDFLRESDLGNYQPLTPPEGKHIVTVRLSVEKMTPFLQPNSKIDVIGTLLTKDGKVKSCILIPDMLVMAVDTNIQPPPGAAKGEMAIQMASLAATQEEALAVAIAEAATVKFRFILRNDLGNSTTDPKSDKWSLEHVKAWINDDNEKPTDVAAEKTPKDPMTPSTSPPEASTKMTVPTEDLKAGTELTYDLVQAKFKEVTVAGMPPTNAVLNIKEHVGRFLVKDVAAEQFVPKNFITDKPAAKDPAGNARGGSDPGPSVPKDVPSDPVKKLPTFDRTYVTPSGSRMFRYEIQENGEKKLLGEVLPDGSVVPATTVPPSATPTPKKDVQ